MPTNETALIGYWNNSKETPDIVFQQPPLDKLSNYTLCIIKLVPVADIKVEAVPQKVKKELRNFVNSIRRLK